MVEILSVQLQPALYIACMMSGIDISQAEIDRAVGIVPVTIRNHYKVFKQLLKK
jgi:transcription initiation factor TFIIIB Brf1 subunit/transcription initiation factor TFIIB